MWFVYLLRCSDDTFYCGITNDLTKRVKTHNDGKGAKYTKGRRPVALLKSWEVGTKGEALKLEFKIKRMTRKEKLELIHD